MRNLFLALSLLLSANAHAFNKVDTASLPVINDIANPGFEQGRAGYSRYLDAAGVLPVDGTGGSPTSTIAVSTSSPLQGAYSLIWTKPASNIQGEGFSYDFTAANEEKAKVLTCRFSYEPSGAGWVGSTTASAVRFFIYDITNATLIQPSVIHLDGVAGGQYKFKTEFQTASNSTSYRAIWHWADTGTSAATFKVDSIFCGSEPKIGAPIVTDWISYSMTIGAVTTPPTKGTTSIDEARWRRVGDSMELAYNYKATTGSAGAGTGAYLFPLPSGYTIDTAKLSLAGTATVNVSAVGPAALGYASNQYGGYVYAANSTNLSLVFYNDVSNPTSFASTTTPNFTNTTLQFSYTARVPITGWGAASTYGNDADTRVVAAKYNTSTQTIGTSFAALVATTKEVDTHGAYSSGVFTAPVGGVYRVSFQAMGAAVTASTVDSFFRASLNKNASQISQFGAFVYQVTAVSLNPVLSGSTLVTANAGDTLEVDLNRDANVTSFALSSGTDKNWVSFERLSGPAAIAASEFVGAKYTAAATAIGTSDTVMVFPTKVWDTHSAMNASTGTYTCPVVGKYRMTSSVQGGAAVSASAVNNGLVMKGRRNTTTETSIMSEFTYHVSSVSLTPYVSGSTEFVCSAGDTLDVTVSRNAAVSAVSADGVAADTWVVIERIGL